jgi:hypothetical protein
MKTKIAAVLASVIMVACAEDALAPSPVAELVNAPVKVRVAGVDLTLETYLYRDFQPITPPNGQPLIAVVRVKTANGATLPAGLDAEVLHVLYGEDVWAASPVEEHPATAPGVLEVVARNGPEWGPGVTVDVVLRLRHGGTTLLLKAAAQQIHRTD